MINEACSLLTKRATPLLLPQVTKLFDGRCPSVTQLLLTRGQSTSARRMGIVHQHYKACHALRARIWVGGACGTLCNHQQSYVAHARGFGRSKLGEQLTHLQKVIPKVKSINILTFNAQDIGSLLITLRLLNNFLNNCNFIYIVQEYFCSTHKIQTVLS